jgi:hypothetical protein
LKIKVVSDEEAEGAHLIVCAPAASFSKKPAFVLECPCSKCGQAVYYSRLSPPLVPKVCLRCAVEHAGLLDAEVITTATTLGGAFGKKQSSN